MPEINFGKTKTISWNQIPGSNLLLIVSSRNMGNMSKKEINQPVYKVKRKATYLTKQLSTIHRLQEHWFLQRKKPHNTFSNCLVQFELSHHIIHWLEDETKLIKISKPSNGFWKALSQIINIHLSDTKHNLRFEAELIFKQHENHISFKISSGACN